MKYLVRMQISASLGQVVEAQEPGDAVSRAQAAVRRLIQANGGDVYFQGVTLAPLTIPEEDAT
jgi:hypothetical protein